MTLPSKIDRFEIKKELGRGGMAIVYQAYDPRFERNVAIKVLPVSHVEDDQFRARFAREAKTVASLEHPAVVPVYDFGEENGRLYLVMRLMPGGSLVKRLQQGPLTPAEAVHVIERIAPALDAAHQQGIVHRDLKPDNILFDQYGAAYLSDFGIARMAQSQATLTGHFAIGTPGYMSPEQIQGEPLDGRSDIYALGAVLFEMLAGKRPFTADTPAMVLVKQMTGTIPKLTDTNPTLSPRYNEIIQQAMAKERTARPATAQMLASQLQTLLPATTPPAATVPRAAGNDRLSNDPTIVEPIPTPSKAKPPQRGWLWGAIGLLLLVGLGAGFWGWLGAVSDPTEEQGVAVSTRPANSEVVGEETAVADDHTSNDHLLTAQNAFDEGNIDLALEEVTAALEHDDTNAAAHLFLGYVHWTRNELGAAFDAFSRAAELDPSNAAPYLAMADIQENRWGEPENAIVNYTLAIEQDDSNDVAYASRCRAYDLIGETALAKADCERCLALTEENSECWVGMGYFASYDGAFVEAIDHWTRALELAPDSPYVHHELAQLYLWHLSEFDLAIDHATQARALYDDPYFTYIRAIAYSQKEMVAEAIADFAYYMETVEPESCDECMLIARHYLENMRPPSADYLTNFAYQRATTAEDGTDSATELVVDGYTYDSWFVDAEPPHWIQIDLGEERTLTAVELLIDQAEPGHTVHEIWGKGSNDADFTLLHTFAEETETNYWLTYEPEAAWENIQYITIETTEAVSPIGWYEIRLLGYGSEE